METYIINGIEVQYDTYDVENIAKFKAETQRYSNTAQELREAKLEDVEEMKGLCSAARSFFDVMFNEGKAEEIFGERNNVRDILLAYKKFVRDVNAAMTTAFDDEPRGNRAQRRRNKKKGRGRR